MRDRDGHSRTVLGCSVASHIGAEMVTTAIEAAVAARGGECRGTVLHSDRGGEYTANLTAQACLRHGLRRSMGATGICWDNSPAESFWSTFKHEHYYRHVYATKTELVAAVDNWVRFYNSTRRHSKLGMRSPATMRSHSEKLPESRKPQSTVRGEPQERQPWQSLVGELKQFLCAQASSCG